MSFSVAPYTISLIVASVVSAIILMFGVTVIWQMWFGKLDLTYLLSEPLLTSGADDKPKASLSRFQFLVFTFVIAGLYLVLSLEAGTMVEVPSGALVLLGISGGSYLVSKVESTRAASVQAAGEAQASDTSGGGQTPGTSAVQKPKLVRARKK